MFVRNIGIKCHLGVELNHDGGRGVLSGNQAVPVVDEGQVVRLGNGVVCHVACGDVEAGSQRGVAVEGGLDAQVGQCHGVAQGDVGQCVRGGVRNSARHVGNAVEDRVVDLVRRFLVGGGVRVLEAAALVNSDVHQDRARLHAGNELVGDQLGSLGARDQDGADHEICVDD